MISTPPRGRLQASAMLLLGLLLWPNLAQAQEQEPSTVPEPKNSTPSEPSVEDRLQRLEQLNASLLEQNKLLLERLDDLSTKYDDVRKAIAPSALEVPNRPLPDPEVEPVQVPDMPPVPDLSPGPIGAMGEPAGSSGSSPDSSEVGPPLLPFPGAIGGGGQGALRQYRTQLVGPRGEPAVLVRSRNQPIEVPSADQGREFPLEAFYDEGFILGSDDEKVPYLLKANLRMQFRHSAFDRSRTFWVDSAGIIRPILNQNEFEIEPRSARLRGLLL